MSSISQDAVSANMVSAEELRVRDELEADIEEDLEREIIDDICGLARHLQRLYQHKDRRELTDSAADLLPLSRTADAVLSELNIRIKLDGQCRIDITKIEQSASRIQQRLWCNTDQFEKRQGSSNLRQNDTTYHRKNKNHPVVPWK